MSSSETTVAIAAGAAGGTGVLGGAAIEHVRTYRPSPNSKIEYETPDFALDGIPQPAGWGEPTIARAAERPGLLESFLGSIKEMLIGVGHRTSGVMTYLGRTYVRTYL